MQDYWLFVFWREPNYDSSVIYVEAIFPPEMTEEALSFVGERPEYRVIGKSTWKFGKIPKYEDTIPFES